MPFEYSNQNRVLVIHHYKPDTGEFIKTDSDVIIIANEGLPAHSTNESLPTIPSGHVAHFNEVNETWSTSESYIGQTAFAKDNTIHNDYIVSSFGPIPSTHTLLVPNTDDKWNGTEWIPDQTKIDAKLAVELAEAKNTRKEYMRSQAKSEIESSFTSNAMGTTHTYDSRPEDQNNLSQAQNEAELSSPQDALVYSNNGTEFDYRIHTLAQIKQVSADCSLHIRPIRVKLIAKKASIDAETTVTGVNSITW